MTADVHVYQASSQQVWYGVLCLTAMMKALVNNFSYWATFSIIWMITSPMGKASNYLFSKVFFCIAKIRVVFKLFPVVFVSIANISSFLQVAFMFDMTAVTEKMDSQILKGCLIITILQTVIPLVTEYTLVNVDNLTNLVDHNFLTDDDGNCSSDDPGKYCYLLWWRPGHPGDRANGQGELLSKLDLSSLLHSVIVVSSISVFVQNGQVQETQEYEQQLYAQSEDHFG